LLVRHEEREKITAKKGGKRGKVSKESTTPKRNEKRSFVSQTSSRPYLRATGKTKRGSKTITEARMGEVISMAVSR